MNKNWSRALSAVLAGALVIGSLVMPGAGISAQAAKKTKKQTKKVTAVAPVPKNPVTVAAALIQGDQVVVTATSGKVPATDDGIYHLYAQEVYESGVQGVEIAQAPAAANAVFQFPLAKNTAKSNLYKKFTVVTVSGGALKEVSNAQYITNPEATTEKMAPRYDGRGKKGLLLEAHLINRTDYLQDLGIHQITYNLPIGNLCQNGNLKYNYNGKTYYFNSGIVGQYDLIVPKMNKAGISVTLILLNNLVGDPTLLHPLSRDSLTANYYAFNTADAAGVEKLEAIAAFLGERYSGSHGTVDNWIVGNEVNARAEWNYITPAVGMDYAAGEYSKALRIFYNGIKSKNANPELFTA